MPRCQAPTHPDCWHECPDGQSCLAFYELETQSCHRGCDGKLLAAGFVSAISRAGWAALTTAQGRGIAVADIGIAAQLIRAMAVDSTGPRPTDPDRLAVGNMARRLEMRVKRVILPGLVLPTRRRFDFEWTAAPIPQALNVLVDVLSRRQGLR